jgi:hydrogenase nickel incorporation protein HypA/HybF
MHEMSLAQALIDQVIELAQKEDCGKVLSVDVSIGALSGVMREALEFCFPVVARGTALEHTRLNVTEVPLKAECGDCRRISSPKPFEVTCSHCGSMNIIVTEGKDFKLVSLEVE